MDWLNYHHLLYFWTTAREGSLTQAARELRLAPSTVSAQIKALEASLGQSLFRREGRGLKLTQHGEVVQAYADDIFALGKELQETLRNERRASHAYRLKVGVSNNLPKLISYRLLGPALELPDFPVHLICEQDEPERLVAELALHRLDVVLSDAPVSLTSDIRAHSVQVGSSSVSLFAAPSLAARYGPGLPTSLDGAPLLLPDVGSAMRGLLEGWFQERHIAPRVVAEFGDSALLKTFGGEGVGIFPAPTIVAEDVASHFGVEHLMELPRLEERFYAIVHPSRGANRAVKAVLGSFGEREL